MATGKLVPQVFGFWIRYVRESLHWSQEALAEASGVTARTIQRIEAGNTANIMTRRALARSLGYENQDIFDDPIFITRLTKTLEAAHSAAQQEMLEQQLPDHIRVKVARVTNSETLARIISNAKATAFYADDDISTQAKRVAASLFDYMSDMVKLYHNISFSERLLIHSELGKLLRELEGLGTAVYSALRTTNANGGHWENQLLVQLTIGYLTVVPAKKDIQEMSVPRRIS